MQVAKNIQAVLAGKPLKAWKPNGGFSVSRWMPLPHCCRLCWKAAKLLFELSSLHRAWVDWPPARDSCATATALEFAVHH